MQNEHNNNQYAGENNTTPRPAIQNPTPSTLAVDGLPIPGERAGVRGNGCSDINPPIRESNNPTVPTFEAGSSNGQSGSDFKVGCSEFVVAGRREPPSPSGRG
jgi:hypothetical protein